MECVNFFYRFRQAANWIVIRNYKWLEFLPVTPWLLNSTHRTVMRWKLENRELCEFHQQKMFISLYVMATQRKRRNPPHKIEICGKCKLNCFGSSVSLYSHYFFLFAYLSCVSIVVVQATSIKPCSCISHETDDMKWNGCRNDVFFVNSNSSEFASLHSHTLAKTLAKRTNELFVLRKWLKFYVAFSLCSMLVHEIIILIKC